MIRKMFLTDLGRHVHDLLLLPADEWRLAGSTLVHRGGVALSMIPGAFDVCDAGLGDFVRELGFIERLVLYPMARRLRAQLKLREITGR